MNLILEANVGLIANDDISNEKQNIKFNLKK
jgi:hypothetical protein